MRLTDKVAVVTGGGRGIGRGICEAFAAEGAKVACVYGHSRDAAEELVRRLTEGGGEAMALQADVRDAEAAQEAVKQVVDRWDRVDILVNNAGIVRDMLLFAMSEEDWTDVIETNLTGMFHFIKAAGRQMSRQRSGKIINISSVSSFFGGAGQVNYAASKGAINSLTRSLAGELAKRNIAVNAIAPGMVVTDMSERVRQMAGDRIESLIPLRRYGQPEDIAKVAVFLASSDSDYVTGQVITVDGGLSLGAKWASD